MNDEKTPLLRNLQSEVASCVKELDRSKPVANRFCNEILKLLNDAEISLQNQETLRLSVQELESILSHTREQVEVATLKVKSSENEIKSVDLEVQSNNDTAQCLEEFVECKRGEIATIMNENKTLQERIDEGPDWTHTQEKDKEDILQQIQVERDKLVEKSSLLKDLQSRTAGIEQSITDVACLRDTAMGSLKKTEERVENLREKNLVGQRQKQRLKDDLNHLELRIQSDTEDLVDLNNTLRKEEVELKNEQIQIKTTREEINRHLKDSDTISRQIDKLSIEINSQKGKNKRLEEENTEMSSLIGWKKTEITGISKEIAKMQMQKDLVAEKIIGVEKEKVHLERERDALKLEIDKTGNVDVKVARHIYETQKRQSECIARDLGLMDKKKESSCTGADMVSDLIKSSGNSLKNLQHELEGLIRSAKANEKTIDNLSSALKRQDSSAEAASQKHADALDRLSEQEQTLIEIQKSTIESDTLLKQKQSLCESIKSECNMQSKTLAENQEDISRAKKELAVLNHDIVQLKGGIKRIEDALVFEHFNHHGTDKGRENLRSEITQIQSQINENDRGLGNHEKEIQRLCAAIDDADKERGKTVKEYHTIMSERDIVESLLVQRNAELDRIQEKIKIQQSTLHHGEVEYKELLSRITELMTILKELNTEKQKLVDQADVYETLVLRCNKLESDIQREKSKNKFLSEELGRPINIHRWRALEHRNTPIFDKIQKIQKLQRQLIETSDEIADKDGLINEKQRSYFDLKRGVDNQSQFSDIKEQLEFYQTNLTEKQQQMEKLTFELEVQKRRVDDLRQSLLDLEDKRRVLKTTWIETKYSDKGSTGIEQLVGEHLDS